MRILQIVPGTCNFYCGSCIRDTALFRALCRQGHEVILQPLYLPLFTDEPTIDTTAPILYGGINVYLQQYIRLFDKTPQWIDRLLDSRWLLNLSARLMGMTRASQLGEMTVSMLAGENGKQTKELNRFADWLKERERFDVVLLSNGLLLGLAKAISHDLGLPLACTLQGEDTFLDALPEPYRAEAWRILASRGKYVETFIPVSRFHGEVMRRRLNLKPDQFDVVQNGISLEGYDTSNTPPEPLSLGYLARMCPDKGLDRLVDAFVELKQRPEFRALQLKIAGTVTKADRTFVDEMKKRLQTAGVLSDVSFHPNISRDEKIRFLTSVSLFSVPATYGESFGLYVIEAMAAAVPVVQPRHGGFTEILERAGGGILYDPEEHNSYVAALAGLLSNSKEAREVGERGRDSVQDYFNADRMARDVMQILERVRQSQPA